MEIRESRDNIQTALQRGAQSVRLSVLHCVATSEEQDRLYWTGELRVRLRQCARSTLKRLSS